MGDIVGLTGLRTLFRMMFFLNFSTRQIETLMMNFDHDNIGEISLSAILGAAQLHHDKWKRSTDELITRKRLQLAGLDRSIGRLEHTRTLENSRIKDMEILAGIIEVLKKVSYNFVTTANIRTATLDRSIIMNSAQFKHLLQDLDIDLTLKQFRVLQKHYWSEDLGGLDFLKFRVEFISLGVQLLIQSDQSDALGTLTPTPGIGLGLGLGLGLGNRCSQSDNVGTSTSRCRLNVLEYEDAVKNSLLVSTVFRVRSGSPDRRRNKWGSAHVHEKKYTFNTYNPQGVKLPHTAPSLNPITDNNTEDAVEGIDFAYSRSSPKSSDQLKLDKFLDAFFSGGGRVSSPSSSLLTAAITAEQSPAESSLRSHIGVGNRIWHCDKHDEYSFNNRSPMGKKLESDPQSTPVNTYMQINTYLRPSVHPCELTRTCNAIPIMKKTLRVNDIDDKVKLHMSVHTVGRRKMKAISSPGKTVSTGLDVTSSKKVTIPMRNILKSQSTCTKIENRDLAHDSNNGYCTGIGNIDVVCGDKFSSRGNNIDDNREHDLDLLSGVEESTDVCDDVTIENEVRTAPYSDVINSNTHIEDSIKCFVEIVSSIDRIDDELEQCNSEDQIASLVDNDTSTSTSSEELVLVPTCQNILTIWTMPILIPSGPKILNHENIQEVDLELFRENHPDLAAVSI